MKGNIIIRKHNEKEYIELMEELWKTVVYYSHRDQLSFNYVLWKTGIRIKYFAKRFSRLYFQKSLFHLINEIYK